MNKQGDIPVTILVIGVFGICVLAILSFNFSISSGRVSLAGPYLIEDVIVISEQISFYENNGINFDVLKKTVPGSELHKRPSLNIRKNPDGSYSVREEFRNPKGIVFSVEYSFNPD